MLWQAEDENSSKHHEYNDKMKRYKLVQKAINTKINEKKNRINRSKQKKKYKIKSKQYQKCNFSFSVFVERN